VWPLPVSATKPMPDRVVKPPVQLTVHSVAIARPLKMAPRGAKQATSTM
jgi:hypothetical protein